MNVSVFRYGLFVPRSVKKTEGLKATNIFGNGDSDEEQVRSRLYRNISSQIKLDIYTPGIRSI